MDTVNMTRMELDWFHTKLLEVKQSEKEAHEKAMAEARQARNSNHRSLPRPRHRPSRRRR